MLFPSNCGIYKEKQDGKGVGSMIDFLNRRRTEILALLTTAAVFLVLMMFTGQWPWRANDYNTYALQVDAWLHGRLDLGQDYPWLELAIYDGKYYASFPPFPSYVLLPFAACFGKDTPDHWIALAFAALAVRYAAALYREICGERGALLWVLFLVLGTGYPFIAVNGYVWFFAQSMCFALSLMALTYAVRGAGGLALTLWACAVGCRPTAVLFLPVLLALLRRAWRAENPAQGLRVFLRRKLYWCAGPVLLAASYMALNFLRFGNVFEFGHNYLPEFVRAPQGQFSLSYIPENLSNLFRLPQWKGEGLPLEFPLTNGMALWLVNPMLLAIAAAWGWTVWKKRREAPFLLWALPSLSLICLFVLCSHRTLGGWQFGNRYLLDLMPWLFCGLALWKPDQAAFDKACIPLFGFGAAVNFAGTILAYNLWG